MPPATNPIHADVPTDKAWKIGRRVYVRCGYQSQLNTQLRELGAKWDPEVRALWVGSGKLEAVLPLVLASAERAATVEAIKRTGHAILIPYDAENIRARAKTLGGIWDQQRKLWIMPTEESVTTIRQALEARRAKILEAKAAVDAAVATEQTEAAARGVEIAKVRSDRIVADSGRIASGEQRRGWCRIGGFLRRPQAEAAAPDPGDVILRSDGTRALVLTTTVEFVSQDAIDDGVSPFDLSDDPGWVCYYDYLPVEPNVEETAADAAERAEWDDLNEIAATMAAADRAPGRAAVSHLTDVVGATVTRKAAGGMTAHGGRITVTDDGAVWYQHPGWYDDYIRTEVQVTDVDLVDRIRAVLAAGTRVRGEYTVST